MFSLEKWIHQIVAHTSGLEHVSRADLDAYRLLKLRQTLQHVWLKSSFYRDLLGHCGLLPEDVRSLRDLTRIPFTEPHHLSESPYRFLCISQAGIARPYSFVTSGTTGPQKKVFWSHGDIERIIDFMAAGIATVAGPEDVVQILLADGRPYSQADLLYRGVIKTGALPVLAGMDLTAEEHLAILEDSHSTVLFGYASRIFRISRELQAKTNLRKNGVKVLFLAGEYVPAAMRDELQHLWDCRVYTHYGLTEMGLGVAIDCAAGDGYHFNEAGLLIEVIDPKTGKAVPEGEEGELVFTTLANEAMPLIRYRTHDVSRLIPEPCPCGAASLLKIDHIRKRLESIVTLDGGDEIYPSLLDDALFQIPELLDYQVILTRHEGKERLDFKVEIISADALPAIHTNLLSLPVISGNIAAGRMIEPSILPFPPGALQSVSRAKKLIVNQGERSSTSQEI
jgi:phenylacetate-CoA ligase